MTRRVLHLSLVSLLALCSCGSEPAGEGEPSREDSGGVEVDTDNLELPTPVTEPLAAPRLARRISLDLRGTLPSVAELDAVEADPTALDGFIEEWLADDEAFAERIVELYAERWLTRVDVYPVYHWDFGFTDEEEFLFEQAVGEEPLRLIAHVATEGLPYEEIVTADYTLANETLADAFTLDYPDELRDEGAGPWAVARYTDDRPSAGVLSSNGLWWRYDTTTFNYNRTRAAAISRLLLCFDYLDRPVVVTASPALLDTDGTEQALRTNPACQACHTSLDPMAAVLFGFWWYDLHDAHEATTYHHEREPMGELEMDVEMAYFGEPVTGLADLGLQIGQDPRFSRCAAETVAEGLWRRDSALRDHPTISSLTRTFEGEGRTLRPLFRAVLDTPEYQAGALLDTATEEDAQRERLVRLLPAPTLATAIEDLAGYRWTWQGFDQLHNDDLGYRTMAGGVDGELTTLSQDVPDPSWVLTTRTVAESAAGWAVERADGSEVPWLAQGPASLDGAGPGDDRFEAVLSELCWRLLAERPTAEELQALSALYAAVEADSDTWTAWEVVLAALLQDPRFLTY